MLLILFILVIIVAFFGSQESLYKVHFTLPFDTTEYTITSDFGTRNDPMTDEIKQHNGIDVVPISHNILAIADGYVISSFYDEGNSGEYIILEHNISGTIFRSSYLHLKKNSRIVEVGDKVLQGQQIGVMGSTGKSTGPHLHLGLQKYNAFKKEFEYTSPTLIITNNQLPRNINLFNYSTNKYDNLFNQNNYEVLLN